MECGQRAEYVRDMESSNRHELAADGIFTRNGRPFVPAGVNYWPASCGVEMWAAWPIAEIEHDLDVLAGSGLNTIRFFLRWQDFEPIAGQYDAEAFEKLRHLLAACRSRGLAAHPSLFVGFMSGGIFWPTWRDGRNVFADVFMVERGVAFAARAAAVIAEFKDCVLSIDQGNELCCLPDAIAAPPAAVIDWCRRVNDAIRDAWPDAILISGNEQAQVANDTGWRFSQQPGCDLYSMHGYPVPAWHPIAFDGMTDPLAQRLLPLYTKVARAFGPVMLQEFGTILAGSAAKQDAYLRGMLPAAWAAGANGFLYWCMRDVVALAHPYTRVPFESTLGLFGDDDQVKPGLRFFVEFTRSLVDQPVPTPGGIGLYFPAHHYHRDAPQNPGNEPRLTARWLAAAEHALGTLGHATRIVRGDLPAIPDDVETLVIAGARLDLHEILRVSDWVARGGRLVWHGVDAASSCARTTPLLGAVAADFRSARTMSVALFGETWPIERFGGGTRSEFAPTTARVLAFDADGVGQAFVNRLGDGAAFWSVGVIEESIAAVAGQPAARDRWCGWYRGALDSVR